LTEVGGPKCLEFLHQVNLSNAGTPQTKNQSVAYNAESDLDLEYAMVLTDSTPITLLQTGDMVEGLYIENCSGGFD
jgi:hypothetical protein